jgi:hypothetical protein
VDVGEEPVEVHVRMRTGARVGVGLPETRSVANPQAPGRMPGPGTSKK